MILKGAKNGLHTGMILIDLRKEFDTLNHKILSDEMKSIDFSHKTIKWFYLTHKAFSVSLGNVFLEVGTINCGIPQGSILGSLLFFFT